MNSRFTLYSADAARGYYFGERFRFYRGGHDEPGQSEHDSKSDEACVREPGHAKPLTPGLMTMYCKHGICYGFMLLAKHESPANVFRAYWERFKEGNAQIMVWSIVMRFRSRSHDIRHGVSAARLLHVSPGSSGAPRSGSIRYTMATTRRAQRVTALRVYAISLLMATVSKTPTSTARSPSRATRRCVTSPISSPS